MQWWNVWQRFWQAVENFAEALDGATTKLRKHCDLDTPLEGFAMQPGLAMQRWFATNAAILQCKDWSCNETANLPVQRPTPRKGVGHDRA